MMPCPGGNLLMLGKYARFYKTTITTHKQLLFRASFCQGNAILTGEDHIFSFSRIPDWVKNNQ
jgi:hypothetical protein